MDLLARNLIDSPERTPLIVQASPPEETRPATLAISPRAFFVGGATGIGLC